MMKNIIKIIKNKINLLNKKIKINDKIKNEFQLNLFQFLFLINFELNQIDFKLI